MHSTRLMKLFAAACLVALAVPLALSGCGGDDAAPNANEDTGIVRGRTIDARTALGLGNVQVAIGNRIVSGGQTQFVQAGAAFSTTPNGDYEITGIPPGTYNTLRVTPSQQLYGPQPDQTVNITIAAGQIVVLAPVLIVDGQPPQPAQN
ncbi:MAG: hypothetical protein HPY44_01465 [Armatimonadetes bacterium]|nr:hypothetical protein [Armatimonadota bacterium]